MRARFLSLVVAASCLCAQAAHAGFTGQLGGGGPGSTFFNLDSSGLTGVATLTGGTVYTNSVVVAAKPPGTTGQFLAAGPDSGNTATLAFNVSAQLAYISFLWGSPDDYNVVTVTTNLSPSQSFTVSNFPPFPSNGPQDFSSYVNFTTNTPGEYFTSLSFTNVPAQNAFEVSNFNTAAPVPGPIVGAGLPGLIMACGGLLVLARRRQRQAV